MTFTAALITVLISLGLLNSPSDIDNMTTTELEELQEIIIIEDIHAGHNNGS